MQLCLAAASRAQRAAPVLSVGHHSCGLRRMAPDLQWVPPDRAVLNACRGVLRDTTEVVTKAKMFRWKPDGVVTHVTAQTADGWPAPIMQVSPGRGLWAADSVLATRPELGMHQQRQAAWSIRWQDWKKLPQPASHQSTELLLPV